MTRPSEQTGWILPFSAPEAASEQTGLATAGGKGANLARMSQAGFPVPGGFLVTTQAYRDFVAANGLDSRILQELAAGPLATPEELEACSARIRAAFAAGEIPAALAAALRGAYAELESGPVAVRSSATAEDLPEMSFAGQQDTYLNVLGEEALLRAVVDCWGSLWTARAIGYRLRNHVSQPGAALAVVVQRMVESQASGVLFTANPLTGLRSETVIDATFGLGEALVSGKVEPDHYVVDPGANRIINKTLGAKAVAIHGQPGGGTAQVEGSRKEQQALEDARILELARLGQKVAEHYGAPQDIEWALADGALYVLQSRAVTSLFPVPEGTPAGALRVFVSFASVQGLLDPVTPLGRAAMQGIFALGGQGLLGIRANGHTQGVLLAAGERLWVNITTIVRNSVGRNVINVAMDFVEPAGKQALLTIWDDPHLLPGKPGISWHARRQLLRLFVPMGGLALLNMIAPNARRRWVVGQGEKILDTLRQQFATVEGDARARLGQQIDLFWKMESRLMPPMFRNFVSLVVTGMASFNGLRELALGLPEKVYGGLAGGWPQLVLDIARGLPNNPTTEMDLTLWDIARQVRGDPALNAEFSQHSPAELADRYHAGTMPPAARAVLDDFLARYGGRGLGEIDMGRARWMEEPLHIFEVLSSYLQIKDDDQAPDVAFERGADAAQTAIDTLVRELRKQPRGWFKSRLAGILARRVRELMGARESPKFFAVRMLNILRQDMLKDGRELVAKGELQQADDLMFLDFDELTAFARREPRDWQGLIAQRRAANAREAMRRQIPRLLLSDGRAFYEGMQAHPGAGDGLTGSPVSPGSVEGRVRVVLDPRRANLQPGEIMVCPGTDPSWTPLFLSAAGLIMEVGGMMTHGAVVAREYGIPAVVGVDQATTRLVNGQRVRVNGSTGIIELLDD